MSPKACIQAASHLIGVDRLAPQVYKTFNHQRRETHARSKDRGIGSSVQTLSTKPSGVKAATSVKPFQIRSRSFTAVVLRLEGAADAAFYDALDDQLRQAPSFFTNAPFVIDLEQAKGIDTERDVAALTEALRERSLSIFGVQNGNAGQTGAAENCGLIPLQGGREAAAPTAQRAEAAQRVIDQTRARTGAAAALPEPEPEPAAPEPALVVTQPVRSGQRIFADRGDLIVVAPVSSGAELIAHGNIHIYGRLRGRALAGVNGDRSARIFCQNLEAELIAIAGLYRTSDDLGPEIREKRVQAFLRGDTLYIEALK